MPASWLSDYSTTLGLWLTIGVWFTFLSAVGVAMYTWVNPSRKAWWWLVVVIFFVGIATPWWLHGSEMNARETAEVRQLVEGRGYTVKAVFPRLNELDATFGTCGPWAVKYEIDGNVIRTWLVEFDEGAEFTDASQVLQDNTLCIPKSDRPTS